jgi:hypothetical protein
MRGRALLGLSSIILTRVSAWSEFDALSVELHDIIGLLPSEADNDFPGNSRIRED